VRRHLLALIIAALALGTTAACGGGPGSGTSDDSEAARIGDRATSDLGRALVALTPCAPTQQQIRDVLDAMSRQQATGRDTDAGDAATQAAIRSSVRSIARAHARSEATGMNAQSIDNLAAWTGIDTLQSGWMDDPDCDKNWVVLLEYASESAVPGVAGALSMTARVPVRLSSAETLEGSAPGAITASMQPVPPCTFAFAPASTTVTIRGRRVERRLDLTLSWAAYTVSGTSTCELPLGRFDTPTPLPFPALDALPVTIDAFSGATTHHPGSGVRLLLLAAP